MFTKRTLFLISGTTKGLGEALVKTVLKDTPASILALSRSLTEEQQSFSPERFKFMKMDFLEPFNEEALDKELSRLKPTKVIFINNAGVVGPIGIIGQLNNDQIQTSIQVNYVAPLVLGNYLTHKYGSDRLSIVNVSTGAANRPVHSWGMYCSSKAAIAMFFEVLKMEVPELTVIQYDPGVIDTDMQREIRSTDFAGRDNFVALKMEGALQTPSAAAQRLLNKLTDEISNFI